MARAPDKPLWRCRACGQSFVTRNTPHSCPPYYYVHRVRLSRPEDVDAQLREWLAEAHEVGRQRHLRDPDWPLARRPPGWVHVHREVAEAMARGEDPSAVR